MLQGTPEGQLPLTCVWISPQQRAYNVQINYTPRWQDYIPPASKPVTHFVLQPILRIFSNRASLGKDIGYIHTSWKELNNTKKNVQLWKFLFHIPIWEQKREAWSSLQKEERWNSCAVLVAQEFAKKIWAYIRFRNYLSVMRPESSNLGWEKCSVRQYPPKETSSHQMV